MTLKKEDLTRINFIIMNSVNRLFFMNSKLNLCHVLRFKFAFEINVSPSDPTQLYPCLVGFQRIKRFSSD